MLWENNFLYKIYRWNECFTKKDHSILKHLQQYPCSIAENAQFRHAAYAHSNWQWSICYEYSQSVKEVSGFSSIINQSLTSLAKRSLVIVSRIYLLHTAYIIMLQCSSSDNLYYPCMLITVRIGINVICRQSWLCQQNVTRGI